MITLSNVMKANALSCIAFGIAFFSFADIIGKFLSLNNQAPTIVFTIIGFALLFNGIHLAWASLKPMPSKFLVLYFSIGDFIWVIGTFYLLLTGLWITTSIGIIATIMVSSMVGTLGFLQMIKRKAMGDC